MYNNYVTYNQKRPMETTHTYTTKPSFPSPHTLKAGKIQNPTWNYRLKEISILGSKSDGGGGRIISVWSLIYSIYENGIKKTHFKSMETTDAQIM